MTSHENQNTFKTWTRSITTVLQWRMYDICIGFTLYDQFRIQDINWK